MDLEDTNTSQQNYVHCSNFPYDEATITKQSTDEDNYHHLLLTLPQPPSNCKRQLSYDNEDGTDVPAPKKSKANDAHHRIAIIIPIMAKRLPRTIANYSCWRRSGFDVVLVYNEDEEGAVTEMLYQYASDMKISFVMHAYTMRVPPNAGIAKHEAYCILKKYLDRPDFQFALLLDDTVNDIINTFTDTEESIMSTPTEFYHAVEDFAVESPVFGGTVAHKRHPKVFKHVQKGIATVKASFLQQALIFSCRGTPTLEKHFKDIDNEYIAKMRRLNYWKVPFGEDVAFQVSLYEQKVLSKEKSPQFWGIGISRIPHKSSTKPAFDQLEDDTKKEIREMLIYLCEQKALSIKPKDELTGVRVIPGGPIRIRINGRKGERPWREAFNYTLPCSTE